MDDKLLSKDDIKIIKGRRFLPNEWFNDKEKNSSNNPKVVVFDLDETLGSFADLYILWRGVKKVWSNFEDFSRLFDLYPEFLRYGILTILEYLYFCKTKHICNKIFVYTNNQCSVTWVKHVCSYIENKVKDRFQNNSLQLFDQYICAFKINNKHIETDRTTHKKTLDDLFCCTKISNNADICFVDDVEYPSMKGSAVYYICPRVYIHSLSTRTIINRVINANWKYNNMLLQSKEFWNSWFLINKKRMTRRGNPDISIDLQVSKKMIHHLSEFLHYERKKKRISNRTKNKRKLSTNRTKKKHSIM